MARIGIIADIHSNDVALSRINRLIGKPMEKKKVSIDQWLFLGDAVGYGPRPVEVLRILDQMVGERDRIIGNHDAWMARLNSMRPFREEAEIVLQHQLFNYSTSEEFRLWVDMWKDPQKSPRFIHRRYKRFDCWFSHGAYTGTAWPNMVENYIYPWPDEEDDQIKKSVFGFLKAHKKEGLPAVMIVGHAHLPMAIGWRKGEPTWSILPVEYQNLNGRSISIEDYELLVLSPGSVGQPRNPDPDTHAACAILDTNMASFEFYIIKYDARDVILNMNDDSIYGEFLIHLLEGRSESNPLEGTNSDWLKWGEIFEWKPTGWFPKGWEE